LKAGQRIRGTTDEIENQLQFDRQLLSYRQTAEWGNRALQGSFGRLRIPLEINFTERRGDLLETCARGYCLRARRVGLNQIRTVYMPQWQAHAEDAEIWRNFETMVFSEQRQKDRVARFHTVANYE
jgi:hypothetical protein